jgi:hypothetical protein
MGGQSIVEVWYISISFEKKTDVPGPTLNLYLHSTSEGLLWDLLLTPDGLLQNKTSVDIGHLMLSYEENIPLLVEPWKK